MPSTASPVRRSQTVIAQRQVAAKSNEIPAFAPLLEHLDLRGVVVTADAMHTQREHAHHIIAAGGDVYWSGWTGHGRRCGGRLAGPPRHRPGRRTRRAASAYPARIRGRSNTSASVASS
ncbi:hypothetical protein [Streptomyces sp. DT203]|uniref:hypothetical protein n=1 Tax=Streptomyces sp. DT203 TaxID=3393424 RepID=UPI003CE8A3DB